jgi:lipopolysaccharide export system permease protein
MKKLHQFIIRSFLGPFIFTFLIAVFLLLMQFLWKYIDDLVGKGLEWTDISKLLFYASFRFVPMALPIAILLSSIMTFGNLGEKYELIAIKSSGISLKKSMRPLLFVVAFIGIGSFFFSNYIMPYANLKAGTLLYDIRKQKPALNIKAGIFYNGIEGFSIKINHKDENGIDLEGVMIYDHTAKSGNDKVIIAERGKMYLSESQQYFVIQLFDGHSYYEMDTSTKRKNSSNRPHQRNSFKEDILRFDLSGFGMKRSSEEIYKNHYAMMSNRQLVNAIDSINSNTLENRGRLNKQVVGRIQQDSSLLGASRHELPSFDKLSKIQQRKVYAAALNAARSNKSLIENSNRDESYRAGLIAKHQVEWHRKLSLALACLSMFLIGAPLGAIVRKGGFGMPVIISVGFFVVFHVLSTTGEKMIKEGAAGVLEGMWAANALFLPIGFWLVYKATRDASLFDSSYHTENIKKVYRKLLNK